MEWVIIIAVLVAVFWLFNYSQGTSGLFKTNLSVFFRALRSGMSIYEAEDAMVSTRYPQEKEPGWHNNKGKVIGLKAEFTDYFKEPGKSTKQLVYAIFCNENGIPPTDRLRDKYAEQIEETYHSMEKQSFPWLSIIPEINRIFENNLRTFPITLKKALNDAQLNGYTSVEVVQLEESLLPTILAWQLITTRELVQEMGYINSKRENMFSDYFFNALSNLIIENQGKIKKDLFFSNVRHYHEVFNDKQTIEQLSNTVCRDLTQKLFGKSSNTFVESASLVLKSLIEAELGYRCSKIALLFGDEKTSKEIINRFEN